MDNYNNNNIKFTWEEVQYIQANLFLCKGCGGGTVIDECRNHFRHCVVRNCGSDFVSICHTCKKVRHICPGCFQALAIRYKLGERLSNEGMADFLRHLKSMRCWQAEMAEEITGEYATQVNEHYHGIEDDETGM